MNVLEQFGRRSMLWLEASESIAPAFALSSVAVATGSAAQLDIEGGCIDYIFTDPPFGSNIFYADCNLIWEAWLDQGFTDQSQEAVVHLKHKHRCPTTPA